MSDPYGALVGYRDAAGAHWYYVLDGHYSVIAVIKSDGTTTGNSTAMTSTGARPTLSRAPCHPAREFWPLTGGYTDPTGLIKFGTRYYEPSLGRPQTPCVLAPNPRRRRLGPGTGPGRPPRPGWGP